MHTIPVVDLDLMNIAPSMFFQIFFLVTVKLAK